VNAFVYDAEMGWTHTYVYWTVDVAADNEQQKREMGAGLDLLNDRGSKGWEVVSVTCAPIADWEWARVPRSAMEEFDLGRAEEAASFTKGVRYTAFLKRPVDAATS
jgi:hypothetical protein